METQEYEFTEMAYTRYQRTWRGFEAIFRRGGSSTLSAYCRSVHVSYEGMKKWVSDSGLSVRRPENRYLYPFHRNKVTEKFNYQNSIIDF